MAPTTYRFDINVHVVQPQVNIRYQTPSASSSLNHPWPGAGAEAIWSSDLMLRPQTYAERLFMTVSDAFHGDLGLLWGAGLVAFTL